MLKKEIYQSLESKSVISCENEDVFLYTLYTLFSMVLKFFRISSIWKIIFKEHKASNVYRNTPDFYRQTELFWMGLIVTEIKLTWINAKEQNPCPGQCGSVGRSVVFAPKSCRSLVGACCGGATDWCFSVSPPPSSLPSSLSKINKYRKI